MTAITTQPAMFRAFGIETVDLDLDFAHTPRPELVTQLLACCTSLDRAACLGLTVGRRIAYLLHIARQSAHPALPLVLACAGCGERMEIALDTSDVARLQPEDDAQPVTVDIDGTQFVLRRPTGSDQLRWRQAAPHNGHSLVEHMIRTLLLEPPFDGRTLPDEVIQRIDEAMREHDPLVNFAVDVQCPACGHGAIYDLDLEAHILDTFRRVQTHLIESVHRLARRYHWGEVEILALPAWRRSRYLALLNREEIGL